MSVMGCYLSCHKWTDSISLAVHYEHFMLVSYITNKGCTGWQIHEKERPGHGDIEIPFEVVKILSFLIDPDFPLTGDEEEEVKQNCSWCFVTYPAPLYGNWEWVSGLMPYGAYLSSREAGYYQHTDYFVSRFGCYEEARKVYEEMKKYEEV